MDPWDGIEAIVSKPMSCKTGVGVAPDLRQVTSHKKARAVGPGFEEEFCGNHNRLTIHIEH